MLCYAVCPAPHRATSPRYSQGCIIRFSSARTLHKLFKALLHFLQNNVCWASPWKISVIPEDQDRFARQEFVLCFHMAICIDVNTVEVKWKCTVILLLVLFEHFLYYLFNSSWIRAAMSRGVLLWSVQKCKVVRCKSTMKVWIIDCPPSVYFNFPEVSFAGPSCIYRHDGIWFVRNLQKLHK